MQRGINRLGLPIPILNLSGIAIGAATYSPADGLLDFTRFHRYELHIEGALQAGANAMLQINPRAAAADVGVGSHYGFGLAGEAGAPPANPGFVAGWGANQLALMQLRSGLTVNHFIIHMQFNVNTQTVSFSWSASGRFNNGNDGAAIADGLARGVAAMDGFKLSVSAGTLTSIDRLRLEGWT